MKAAHGAPPPHIMNAPATLLLMRTTAGAYTVGYNHSEGVVIGDYSGTVAQCQKVLAGVRSCNGGSSVRMRSIPIGFTIGAKYVDDPVAPPQGQTLTAKPTPPVARPPIGSPLRRPTVVEPDPPKAKKKRGRPRKSAG